MSVSLTVTGQYSNGKSRQVGFVAHDAPGNPLPTGWTRDTAEFLKLYMAQIESAVDAAGNVKFDYIDIGIRWDKKTRWVYCVISAKTLKSLREKGVDRNLHANQRVDILDCTRYRLARTLWMHVRPVLHNMLAEAANSP